MFRLQIDFSITKWCSSQKMDGRRKIAIHQKILLAEISKIVLPVKYTFLHLWKGDNYVQLTLKYFSNTEAKQLRLRREAFLAMASLSLGSEANSNLRVTSNPSWRSNCHILMHIKVSYRLMGMYIWVKVTNHCYHMQRYHCLILIGKSLSHDTKNLWPIP